MLDLSKMEAEMMEYEFTPCDPAALIFRSIDSMKLIAGKKGIDLQTYVPDDLPLLLLDERRMQQVLDNLLSNALKFTPEGGKVFVAAQVHRNSDRSARQVKVIVSDTGPGDSGRGSRKGLQALLPEPPQHGKESPRHGPRPGHCPPHCRGS